MIETIGGAVAVVLGELDDIKAKVNQLLEHNQVSKKAESPLRVSVTSEAELQRLKKLRDRLREQPAELVDAELQSLLGDGLAAAGQYTDAEKAHGAAVIAAHAIADTTTEVDAAYKQFKDACELGRWDAALIALQRAVALDERRFRPVPKHYTIDAILGMGSFGVVFKCRDLSERNDDGEHVTVAVKTFRANDLDRPLDKVFAEANVLKRLGHDNIVAIHERGFADPENQQRPFLAMEFVPGESLERILATKGKLCLSTFSDVFRQIAAALNAAHSSRWQVIHRDLKPANLMVRYDVTDRFHADKDRRNGVIEEDGQRVIWSAKWYCWRVKVLDFGLAVRNAARTASLRTPSVFRSSRDLSVAGTVKYAAPEQLGERPYPVGPHSDVFAFGKTALEALLGTTQPTPKHWKKLPEWLAEMLARCVDEDYFPDSPDEGRFHGFAPILEILTHPPPTTPPIPSFPPPSQTNPSNQPFTYADFAAAFNPLADAIAAENLASATNPAKLRTACPLCRARFKFPPKRGGERVKCPQCGMWLVLPTQDGGTAIISPTFAPETSSQTRKAGDKLYLPLPGGLWMAFAWCPPGTFLMGSPASEAERSEDELQHEVRLTNGFYCGVHPVTRGEFARFVAQTKYKTEAEMSGGGRKWTGSKWDLDPSTNWRNPGFTQTDDHPVTMVSWNDAVAFCQWLVTQTKHRVRLPTEAEWEYACRGGTTTPFYWGGELNGTQANSNGEFPYGTEMMGPYQEKTAPVGSYAKKFPHPWGLTDVHGNVWEWCADWYDREFYARSTKNDPECRDGRLEYELCIESSVAAHGTTLSWVVVPPPDTTTGLRKARAT